MRKTLWASAVVAVCVVTVWAAAFVSAQTPFGTPRSPRGRLGPRDDRPAFDDTINANALDLFNRGRQTFRFDTFGDEHFWGDTLKLHQALEGARFGGVGPGVSPAAALGAGLKVDVDMLPPSLIQSLQGGRVDLNDPANTLALLNLNAVVGVLPIGSTGSGGMQSVGITCALCHSSVDDALAPGIGHRRDGWPNRDLNVGAITAASPDLSAVAALLGVDQVTVRTVLNSWGPGKFDAELFLDGKAFRPDGRSAATVIPAAFGLAGVNLHTYTGWGSVPYWNAFVANLEMHGSGTFFDPRLNNASQFPVAARAGMGNVRGQPDTITAKLPALHFYQMSIPAPAPPAGSFNQSAADHGQTIFNGVARCSTCHVAPLFTEPGWQMHTGDEIGIDSFQADRAPDHRYRTTPLRGVWARQKGGFYHDGRYPTLLSVVQHYNQTFNLRLSDSEMNDLVEYLKSL
jgi:cytochrome c5